MKLSVGICTWNRVALLDRTIWAMHDLRIPAGLEWDRLL
jgi:hypothetical protein